MPLHDYKCQGAGCEVAFESMTPVCPSCKGTDVKKLVSFRQSSPRFTEKLYPFYHQGIGEVVNSEDDLGRKCAQHGFYSKHEGANMTPRHERHLLAKRLHERPRETEEKVRWSGRGANLPMIEAYDPETGESGEPANYQQANES